MEIHNDLEFTANYAKELLDENVKLTEQRRVEIERFRSQIEELEQEKHILKGKLDAKVQLEADYQADIDALQTNANEKIATLKKSFNTKLSTLEETNSRLAKDLEESVKNEEISTTKVLQLEAELKLLKEQIIALKLTPNLNSSARGKSESDLDELQEENTKLQTELQELRCIENRMQATLKDSQDRLEEAHQLISELRDEVRVLKRDFEDCKDSLIEAYSELNLLKATPVENVSKGNSLFAEVNDHRLKLEAQLLTLKSQNDRFREESGIHKAEIFKLKMQIGSLMQMGAAGSQNNRLVETLSGSLEAAKSEISALRSKLDKLKSSPIPVTSGKSNDSVNQCWSDAIIQQLRGEVDQLQSQIDTEKFQRFATEDDLIKAERKLADAERQRDELAAVNYRLSVQLEDIKCRSTPTENHRSAKVLVETLPADHGCQKENSPKKKGVKIAESLTVYSATGDSTSKRLSQIGLNSNSSEEKISRPKGRKVLTNIVDSTCENTLISNDNCNQQ